MISLRPMTQSEFDDYLERAVPEYAQAHLDNGVPDRASAIERAKGDYLALLPAGLRSEAMHLLSIRAAGRARPIGMVWYELRDDDGCRTAFIYDFRIDEAERGRGYGRETLARVDEQLRALGARSVGLNVLGHNQRARALYEKHGFKVESITMRKVFAARQEA